MNTPPKCPVCFCIYEPTLSLDDWDTYKKLNDTQIQYSNNEQCRSCNSHIVVTAITTTELTIAVKETTTEELENRQRTLELQLKNVTNTLNRVRQYKLTHETPTRQTL